MHILLFGSSGFIGSYFKIHFLRLGFSVTGVDCVSDNFNHPSFDFIQGDLSSFQFFSALMLNREFNFLVNCAARTDLNGRSLDAYRANFLIPQYISQFYQTHTFPGSRVIHFSSMLHAEKPGSLSYFYGKSKDIGDHSLHLHPNNFISSTIELPSVWGPYMKAPYLKFFNLVRSRLYFYTSYFSGLKSFLFVGNLFQLVLNILDSEMPVSRIVAKDYDLSSNEFARLISSSMGFRLFTLPDFFIYLLSVLGDISGFFNLPFPINSFRLSNMSKGRVVTPTCIDPDTYSVHTIESAISQTLDYLDACR